jgi:hypothetical protein
LRVTFADDRSFTYRPDGKKVIERTDLGEVEVSAEWKKDGRLVVVRKDILRKVTESYAVSSDGKLLTVLTEIADDRGKLELKRLYRPVGVMDDSGDY